MAIKILYILSSYNRFVGTPKKTLDLIKYSSNTCYLYVWSDAYSKEFKQDFVDAGAIIFEGSYKRNIFKHIFHLLKIVDKYSIKIIQTQFFFGELLGGLLKLLRPKVKLMVAFVGSMSPKGYRKIILNILYRKVDGFVYISKYVKEEKVKAFSSLKKKLSAIIYNGTKKPVSSNKVVTKDEKCITILCVSSLLEIKNIQILIDCLEILLNRKYAQVEFLIAGDGPKKESFENQIKEKNLTHNFKLLGHIKNVGDLYKRTDIFVHPCYVEGFGIAVAEAMVEEKPIIVSNAGALPELIAHEKTGLLVAPFNAEAWADAIIGLIENPLFAKDMAKNAKKVAEKKFAVSEFVNGYNNFYKRLI